MGAKPRKPDILVVAKREVNSFSELNCKITDYFSVGNRYPRCCSKLPSSLFHSILRAKSKMPFRAVEVIFFVRGQAYL